MKPQRRTAHGFTLIELVVVIAVIGILVALAAPKLGDFGKSARATKMNSAAFSIAQNWTLVTSKCGVTSAAASNPLLVASKTAEDVIFEGAAAVAASHQACYAASKVVPLTALAEPGAAAGTYNVAGYGATLAGGGTTPLEVRYAGVPDEVTLPLVQNYQPQLTALAASDLTANNVRYSALASGARTVTMLVPVN